MFSLIITLISIALVAALALASLYYGGPVFNQGAARAKVAQIQNAFQQLNGANELYKADTGSYAQSLGELVNNHYLKSVPVAQADPGLLSPAFAADSFTFSMVAPGINAFAASMVSLDICKEVNRQAFGVEGVLVAPHASNAVTVQCYGPDVQHLVVIQGKSPLDLVTLSSTPNTSVPIPNVSLAAVPAASVKGGIDGWLDLTAPTTPVTPPSSAPLVFEMSLPVSTFAAAPIYTPGLDSVTYIDYGTNGPAYLNKTFSGTLSMYGGSVWTPYVVDKVNGDIYTSGDVPNLQKFDKSTFSWTTLSSPGCELMAIYGEKLFMNCAGAVTSYNKDTGAAYATAYPQLPINSITDVTAQNQSLDTLLNANWGNPQVSFMNVNTGIATTWDLTVSGQTFLTQSNRMYVQDGDNELYQIINGNAVKIYTAQEIAAAGCTYYNGVITTIFERTNGSSYLACGYGTEPNSSMTTATHILKFTPAQ